MGITLERRTCVKQASNREIRTERQKSSSRIKNKIGYFERFPINTYSMTIYVLLHLEHEDDVTIIFKYLDEAPQSLIMIT